MQTQNQRQVNKKIKLKKSQILLLGSLLVFFGFCVMFSEYFAKMKDDVFANMRIETKGELVTEGEETEVPITNNLPSDTGTVHAQKEIDYSKYLGVLEIPKIGLKRGFYNLGSKYNDIQYNVAMVEGSDLPDVVNGNLILMAHSGVSYISYFEYLHTLSLGDKAYVTYKGDKYTYKLVNVYDVEKNGSVKIVRSYEKTTLTLITCTKNNDYAQTVYILELV